MRAPQLTRFKICCIASPEEAWRAIEAGASALGLVSKMPSGPGTIPDELIAQIASRVPPGVDTFLLTSLTDPEAIAEQHRCAGTAVIQLVDRLEPAARARLRALLPGVRLVQVVHVTGEEALERAAEAAEAADAVLLDSGSPDAAVRELGGTGRRHDWAISRAIRERLDVPVYLAGGLNAENVAEAIATVGPFAVDVCSGVRDGDFALDPARLDAFAAVVRGAAAP